MEVEVVVWKMLYQEHSLELANLPVHMANVIEMKFVALKEWVGRNQCRVREKDAPETEEVKNAFNLIRIPTQSVVHWFVFIYWNLYNLDSFTICCNNT